MPSNVTAKIESALKRRKAIAVLLVILAFIICAVLWASRQSTQNITLQVNDRRYMLEVADTPGKQEQGLSDRRSLARNQGMLFVFGQESKLCFWMKDMHFPLDIIWLDASRRVVYIEQNLSPETYPEEFCSHTPAKYVLELNAGEATRTGIHKGQVLRF